MHQISRRSARSQTKIPQTPWIFHPLFLCLWIFICLLCSWGLWRSVGAMRQSIDRQKQAQLRLKEEETRALDLIDKLNKADTSFAKEKIIRDELQMQRPDETLLEIPKN